MANDPAPSQVIGLQVLGPSGFLRNVTGDEAGRAWSLLFFCFFIPDSVVLIPSF